MTGFYDQPREIGIVFIKSIEDLEKDAEYHDYQAPFLFANYKVVDKTCNKDLKFNVSLNKAEARRQRQLAYKKHAKCEVVIEELHLVDNMIMGVRDIFGRKEHHYKVEAAADLTHERSKTDPSIRIKRKEIMGFSNNINMNGKVKSIVSDKIINTKNGQMRMLVIDFEDSYGDTIHVTIWGDMANGIVEGSGLEIRKAEVSTYQYAVNYELQIPRYGSVKITSVPEPVKPIKLPEDGLVMTLNFKSKNDFGNFMEFVTPAIRVEDTAYIDYVNGSITIRNPTRYERFGMKITELGSIPNEPRSKRIEKLEGVIKDNFVTVGVLNDGAYGQKGTVLKENWAYEVVKDDESKHLSFMDKYSYKCGQCHEKYGYKQDAEQCSKKHIPYGKMIGDYVKSVEIVKQ